MYCSSCGSKLPEGACVCAQCHAQPAAAEPFAAAGAHPACHAIAILIGLKVAMSLLGLWRMASFLLTQPNFARSARFSFLGAPVSVYTHMMITMAVLVTMAVCVIGLYRQNRRAWGVLLGLRALLLPPALFGVYRIASLFMDRRISVPSFSMLFAVGLNISGALFDVALIVLLLVYKRELVR
jgi:hypothetical protein